MKRNGDSYRKANHVAKSRGPHAASNPWNPVWHVDTEVGERPQLLPLALAWDSCWCHCLVLQAIRAEIHYGFCCAPPQDLVAIAPIEYPRTSAPRGSLQGPPQRCGIVASVLFASVALHVVNAPQLRLPLGAAPTPQLGPTRKTRPRGSLATSAPYWNPGSHPAAALRKDRLSGLLRQPQVRHLCHRACAQQPRLLWPRTRGQGGSWTS